ncbi:MAG TPA: carbohydrate kinase family protein [Dysgonomonas sp.]|nr:carbohydrate kinase family protein [Dysgonomonas sp.]
MKEFDIIAIGELNADIILNGIDGMPVIGKEIFAKDMLVTLGSSTAIFAANAAALGMKVAIVGMIGKDILGGLVRKELNAKGVDTSMLIEHPSIPTGATIVMSYDEDRANVTFQGTMDVMTLEDIDPGIFKRARHIHVSSIFMQSGIKKDLKRIYELARQNGATTSLDTQWDPVEKWDFDYKELLPLISVFLPNETELCCMTGSNGIQEAINRIRPYMNTCVIKQGSRGSLLIDKDGTINPLPAYINQNVTDSIGAGDSFNSGFIARYIKGAPLPDCQDFGNLAGALNTTSAGGTSAFNSREKLKSTAKKIFNKDISWL